MNLFSTPEELVREGKMLFDAKDYEKAIKCYERAYKKGNHDAMFGMFDCYKKIGQLDAGYELLQQHVEDPEFTVEERIRICRICINKKHHLEKYRHIAASLGDTKTQLELFEQAKSDAELDALLLYGENILNNPHANNAAKCTVLHEYIARVTHIECIGENTYRFCDGAIGNHTYVSLLTQMVNMIGSDKRITEAKISYVRYFLVDYYENTFSKNKVAIQETFKKVVDCPIDLMSLLHSITSESSLVHYYLSVAYSYNVGLIDAPRYDLAEEHLAIMEGCKKLPIDDNTPHARLLIELHNSRCIARQREHIWIQKQKIAAEQGDVSAQEELFTRAINDNNEVSLLYYGEKLLCNNQSADEQRLGVLLEYLKRVACREDIGNNQYVYYNGTYGGHTYLDLLREVINFKCISREIRTDVTLAIVRYYLIVSASWDGTFEKYRDALTCNESLGDLLSTILPYSKLARYYFALLYTFGMNLVEPNYLKAYDALCPQMDLAVPGVTRDFSAMCTAPTYQTVLKALEDCDNINSLVTYIRCRKEQPAWDAIIGNHAFKEAISKQLFALDRQYNTWDYSSNFSALLHKRRRMDAHFWVFDGENGTAKRTLAQIYGKMLASCYFTTSKFVTVDASKLNAFLFDKDRYEYLDDCIEDLTDRGIGVLYFENAHLVAEGYNRALFKGLSSAIHYLRNKLDKRLTGSVLILAGNGAMITQQVVELGVPSYQYKQIPFYGYSAEEVCNLLVMLNAQEATHGGGIELTAEILQRVQQIITLKNNTNSRNATYEDVTFVYEVLRNHYFENPSNFTQGIDEAFEYIEKEMHVYQQVESDFEQTMHDLDAMTGLTQIKSKMRNIIGSVRINNMRKQRNLKVSNGSLHMVFTGNPGTGKTTVAKMMGRIFKELGVLQKGHVVEVTRADLIANYLGQTAGKTRAVLNRALHGVLFIDEAYSLTNKQHSGGADYGTEALEEILKFMSDHQNEICVIVAGYKKEMHEFIMTNPGLHSRFNTTIEFDDYSEEELYEIFEKLCRQNDYFVHEDVKPIIMAEFARAKASGSHFGNARYVVSYFNDLAGRLGNLLIAKYANSPGALPSDSELQTFTIELFDVDSNCSKQFRFADLLPSSDVQ